MFTTYQQNLLVFLCCLFASSLFAQGEDVPLINGRPIDPLRYDEFHGSPYLFKDWQRGNIITNDFYTFSDILLNYNGKTKEFEVRCKEEFIELDTRYYMRIEVPQENGDTLLFQRGIHPRYPARFFEICYLSKSYILIKENIAEVFVQKINSVAGISDVKKFKRSERYFLNYNGQIQNIFLSKKKIASILENKKLVDKIISEHKINLKREKGLVALLGHLDEVK